LVVIVTWFQLFLVVGAIVTWLQLFLVVHAKVVYDFLVFSFRSELEAIRVKGGLTHCLRGPELKPIWIKVGLIRLGRGRFRVNGQI
jgi:hypothetical protein